MRLTNLIDEGERLKNRREENNVYNSKASDQKKEVWINKSLSYLQENYPESLLTSDFIEESKRVDKDYKSMVGILKGLKDVESEIGMLDE